MTKFDRLIDAYRTCAEALVLLRRHLRQHLNGGSQLEGDTGLLPEELQSFLHQRQSRERGIHWGLGESCDLLDYAGFANLFEVIAGHEGLLQQFSSLAPDVNLLRSRFLEMDTVFNRVAFARPVSDSDIEFLAGFDERLRRLITAGPPVVPPARAPVKMETPKVDKVPPPVSEEPPRQPSAPAKPTTKTPPAAKEPEPEPAPAALPELPRRDLEQLLAEEDAAGILTTLYHEITVTADGLWGSGTPPLPRVWERVRESEWYRANFVPLGLKPVSDFYDVAETAREKLLSGVSRNQIQDLLRERNFAQLLLSLRDLFRKHLQSEGGAKQKGAARSHN